MPTFTDQLKRSVATNILKEVYLPRIRQAVPTKTLLLNRLRRNREDVSGMEYNISVHEGYSEAIAYSDGSFFPQPQHNLYARLRGELQRMYSQIQVDNKVIFNMKDNLGAYVRAVDSEVKGMTMSLKIAANEECFLGAGGIRCRISAVAGATPAAGYATITALTTDTLYEPTVKYIRPGMVLSFLDSTPGTPTATAAAIMCSNGAGICTAKVQSVDRMNKTFVVAPDVSAWATAPAVNDAVVRSVEGQSTVVGTAVSVYRNPYGLFDLISNDDVNDNSKYFDSTMAGENAIERYKIGGLSVDNALEWWKAYVQSSVGAWKELTVEKALNWIEEFSNGAATIGITSFGGLRAAKNELLKDRRINAPIRILDGWCRGIEHAGLMLVADRHCQSNTWYFPDESHLFFCESNPGQWREVSGQVMLPRELSDKWFAVWFWFHDMMTDMRHVHAVLRGVTEE